MEKVIFRVIAPDTHFLNEIRHLGLNKGLFQFSSILLMRSLNFMAMNLIHIFVDLIIPLFPQTPNLNLEIMSV